VKRVPIDTPAAPVSARIATLGNDDIGAGVCGLPRHRQCLHLTDDFRPGCFDARKIRSRIAEGQHDRHRSRRQCDIQGRWIAVQAPGDEADRDTRVSGGGDFAPDRLGVRTWADNAQGTRVADSVRQRATGDTTHGCSQDRVLDAEQSGQRRFDTCHSFLPRGL
jgi:hypothetical protein